MVMVARVQVEVARQGVAVSVQVAGERNMR
jgi:hypothetical protein